MPDRKPIKAFKPNSSPQNASPYIEEDAEDVPDKKQFIARGLLLICLMLVSIGAAYDLGTKLAASPKARKHRAVKVSHLAGGEPNTHPKASEWLAKKFPDGAGLDTGSRMCFCPPAAPADCQADSNRLVLWGRGYQWGFFSLFYGVLCALDEFGSKTVIDFTSSPEGENLYQAVRGDNTWEYAFEQPGNHSLVDVELDACSKPAAFRQAGKGDAARAPACIVRPYEEVAQGDMGCSDDAASGMRCCTLHGDAERAVARDKVAFEQLPFLKRCRADIGYPNRELTPEGVQRARDLAKKYLRLKPAMKAQYDAFFNSHMRGKDVLIGVHKRETDKVLECAAPAADDYYKIIDQILVDNDGKEVVIYLATDSSAAIQAYKERYGAKVVYRADSIRSSGTEAVHLAKGNRAAGRKQVREVVLDALLLGRCEFLIRTGSGVSMAAQVFSDPGQTVHYLHAGHC